MTEKNPRTRVVGRRSMPAPATRLMKTLEELSGSFYDTELDDETSAPEPGRDPAEVLAEVMLAATLSQPRLNLSHARAAGAVICVVVPDAEWLDPVMRAWRRNVSGEHLTHKASGYQDFRSLFVRSYVFTAFEAPRMTDRDQDNPFFAEVLGHGHGAVGFSPDLAWLPRDLVAAMDYEVVLGKPKSCMLSDAVDRLMGSRATFVLTDEEAARLTPRLLRLSVRPLQDADAYLLKLRGMLAREATVAAAAAAPKCPVRDEPTLERIHGMDEAVAWGFRLRDDLDAFRKGERSWSDVDGGLLLSGPPGTGKTMFARALARTCGVPLVSGSYASWLANGTAHQGDLLKAMRQAFKDARAAAPAILFIDEVDSFPDRARVHHNQEWTTDTVNALLAEIDGVEGREGVVVVGACNHPDKLDPALVRAGRLDHHIRVGLPDRQALACVMREHLGADLAGEGLEEDALLALGCTGADVEKTVRGARRRARSAGRPMERADLRAELTGDDRRSEAKLLLVSVHEAGHAVAAHAAGIPIKGLSLRQVGLQSGRIHTTLADTFLTIAVVQDRLVMLLAGRAAEEVILHRVTSGAGGSRDSDLAIATRLAAASASELGLEEDHGLTWAEVPDRPEDLRRLLADDPRLAALVRKRLAGAYATALNLVERNQNAVLRLAERLRQRIAMGPDEVAEVLAAAGCRP